MYPFEEDICWDDLGDYSTINDFDASSFYLANPSETGGVSLNSEAPAEKCLKRGRDERACCQSGSMACREKLRRERMNDRFAELCSFLHEEKPAKSDKCAILGDAICALSKLKSDRQELEEKKKKLKEGIRNLRVEKSELKEEKLQLKVNKEGMELKIKTTTTCPGAFVPVPAAVYQAPTNKTMAFHGYHGFPMWQWISHTVLDTSKDHVLRPPVA